jgi:PPOX class probable FMN-dependent enzyme
VSAGISPAGTVALPPTEGLNVDAKCAAIADARFREVITTESELRKIVGPANRWFTSKMLERLDRRCRDFVAASPFVVVGSTDPLGMIDLSPKGDRAGFVRCLDDATLAIPDRRGNRRVDTFHNLLQNPGVGLIFLIPGRRETLRVAGRAFIVRDRDVRNAMADNGRLPELAMIVRVERAFFHCGKCVTRANLWNCAADRSPAWPDDAPTL